MVKVNVDPRLQPIYDEAMGILKENEKELLKYSEKKTLGGAMRCITEVKVNDKATRRRGCMKPNGAGKAIVEISGYMLSFPEREILTTMVHELLHCFKDSSGHTGEWLHRANMLKRKTGLNITRTRHIDNEWTLRKEYDEERKAARAARRSYYKPRPKSNKRIICKCDQCGLELVRTKETRFTKHPERYSHRGCKGHFKRVEVRVELL